MSDLVSERRRVTIDLSTEHIPELMGLLGSFVASHNLSIEFGNPASADTEVTRYNPDRVDWLLDPTTGTKVAVVTRARLAVFEKKRMVESPEIYKTPGRVERLFNATNRDARRDGSIARPFVFLEEGAMVGFLADRLPRFAEEVVANSIDLVNVGVKGGEFLLDFCKDLVLPQ